MEINLITSIDNIDGGDVYQGNAPDDDIVKYPFRHDLVLVEMAAGIDALHWVRQGDLKAVLYFGIDDSPGACLDDRLLIALARTCTEFLRASCDVLFGCAAGVSRSSYADCATLMHKFNLSFDDALALIRRSRPVANPNSGFVAQLRRLEPALRSVVGD